MRWRVGMGTYMKSRLLDLILRWPFLRSREEARLAVSCSLSSGKLYYSHNHIKATRERTEGLLDLQTHFEMIDRGMILDM